MSALHKIINKGSYDSMLEYILWRFWIINQLPADRETAEKAAAELAAYKAVAEAARKHIRWCDAGGATIEDALNKLDALKNIARTAGER